MAPQVSTIIATYNRADLVCQAIESALIQTHEPHEVIVVDDGSEDDTRERVAREYGDRVRVLHQEQAGPSRARNLGVARARGELIAFLDSDDAWDGRKIARQVALLQSDPRLAYSYTRCGEMAADGARTGRIYGRTGNGHTGWNFPAVLQASPIILPALLVRRRVFEDLGGFDNSIDIGEDTSFLLRLAMDHHGGYAPETLTWVRCHPGRKTVEDRVVGKNHRSRVYLLTRLLTELGPEHPLHRMVVGRLVSARTASTAFRGRGVGWDDFGVILRDDAVAFAGHAGDADLAVFIAGSMTSWRRSASEAVAGEALARQIDGLIDGLIDALQGAHGARPRLRAHVHAALVWQAMRARDIVLARGFASSAVRDPRAVAAVVRAEGQRIAERRLVRVRQSLGWPGVRGPGS